jgi:hypothetical protein
MIQTCTSYTHIANMGQHHCAFVSDATFCCALCVDLNYLPVSFWLGGLCVQICSEKVSHGDIVCTF